VKDRLEETLARLLRTLPAPRIQNTFMRLTDRETAVSLGSLEEEDRERVLSLLPALKKERVLQEMRQIRTRVRVPREKYEQITSHVIGVLRGTARGNVTSWVKPKKG